MTSDRSTKNKITISDNGNRPLTFKISEVEVADAAKRFVAQKSR